MRALISLTNAYTPARPTLNFIECFWLGSVRSAFKLNSKCTQMNYEMNCITMAKLLSELFYCWAGTINRGGLYTEVITHGVPGREG